MQTKICFELLEVIDKQEEMIKKQNDMIAKLVNENMEKENMINELAKQEEFLY